MAKAKTQDQDCSFVVGDDGLASWSDLHRDAWIGLLETHKRLTRALDAELEASHGLTLSATEALGRLAATDDRVMRLSDLATQTGLSLSRVSRIVDTLESRGLVSRCPSETDGRSRMARLTDDGLTLVRQAQAAHFASVQERFFAQLSEDELATLAAVFTRFAPRSGQDCTVE